MTGTAAACRAGAITCQALLELEKEHVFRNHWQIVGHVSDMPNAGDYLAIDIVGERALVVRGKDGVVRGFHNLCRHRGSRVVADNKGNSQECAGLPVPRLGLQPRRHAARRARPRSFPDLDKTEFGLTPLELEIWMGFIFVRFRKGPQPSVAELMQPIEDEISHYRIGEMLPAYGVWSQKTPVNWKSVRDVDNEGYHVAMAHPALQDLYGSTYFDEPFKNGVSRSFATYNPHAGRRWSVRNYVAHLARGDAPAGTPAQGLDLLRHLPEHGDRADARDRPVLPGIPAVDRPDSAARRDLPLSPTKAGVRRAARYLALRIDRETTAEDVQLSVWSNGSMLSDAFEGFYLSDLEYGVRTHHDHLRRMLPVLQLESAPEEKDMWGINEALQSRS